MQKILPPKTSVFLPSIRSGWNTGAFFRTADSLGIEKVFLSGLTPFPPHKEISKTALDADMFVPWTYFESDVEAVKFLKNSEIKIVAVELTDDAVELSPEVFREISEKNPENSGICLMMGNEISGVSDELLEYAEKTVFIPMKGKKQSMNVSVAGAIAMYEMMKNF